MESCRAETGSAPVRELVLDCVEPGSVTLTPLPSEASKMLLKANVRLKPLPNFFPIVMAIACRDAEAIAAALRKRVKNR